MAPIATPRTARDVARAATPRTARGGMPNMPGFVSNAATGKKVGQTLKHVPGQGQFVGDAPGAEVPKLDMATLRQLSETRYASPAHTARSQAAYEERERLKSSARNTFSLDVAPNWLKHDRQVLRFFAYFQESIEENQRESVRLRKCVIFFYLEDGTMMVSEPKQENSGIPQGTLVKRHMIPKEANANYKYEDLGVCKTVTIYSRPFRIYDCDEFTRSFYEQGMGIIQPPAERIPEDGFTEFSEGLTQAGVYSYREVDEGGQDYFNLLKGSTRQNQLLQQYLQNDRKVLRFHAYWDDTSYTGSGARVWLRVHYYLADDSVEVVEKFEKNAGREPSSALVKRGPLPKNPQTVPAPGMTMSRFENYRPEDLAVGATIDVYGREVFLYDCDAFTRNFYRQYQGVEQGRVEIVEPEQVAPKAPLPPYTGFGAEEDSLGSCYHLTPRPPKRDVNKLMLEAGKLLRFMGKMVDGKCREDQLRRFVLITYIADDTFAVWEAKQRNSGFDGGKWAAQMKRKNPQTGQYYRCQDFFVGNTVEVNGVKFLITAADEAALSYMEAHGDEFRLSDVQLVASKLRGLEKTLRGGQLTLEELRRLARAELGLELTEQELITLARGFGQHEGPEARGVVQTEPLVQYLRQF